MRGLQRNIRATSLGSINLQPPCGVPLQPNPPHNPAHRYGLATTLALPNTDAQGRGNLRFRGLAKLFCQ